MRLQTGQKRSNSRPKCPKNSSEEEFRCAHCSDHVINLCASWGKQERTFGKAKDAVCSWISKKIFLTKPNCSLSKNSILRVRHQGKMEKLKKTWQCWTQRNLECNMNVKGEKSYQSLQQHQAVVAQEENRGCRAGPEGWWCELTKRPQYVRLPDCLSEVTVLSPSRSRRTPRTLNRATSRSSPMTMPSLAACQRRTNTNIEESPLTFWNGVWRTIFSLTSVWAGFFSGPSKTLVAMFWGESSWRRLNKLIPELWFCPGLQTERCRLEPTSVRSNSSHPQHHPGGPGQLLQPRTEATSVQEGWRSPSLCNTLWIMQ